LPALGNALLQQFHSMGFDHCSPAVTVGDGLITVSVRWGRHRQQGTDDNVAIGILNPSHRLRLRRGFYATATLERTPDGADAGQRAVKIEVVPRGAD
jgi:hypothetical protein